MKGKKKFWKMPSGSKILNVIASLAVIVSSIIVAWAALEVRGVFVMTKPDLRATVRPMLMETSGVGQSGIGEDSWTLYYHDEENIEYLYINVDIFNIGSGVAYDLRVKLSLPGLKYSQMEVEEDGGVKQYVDGEWKGTTYSWTDNFYYTGIVLAPQGSKVNLRLDIPFCAIGSIENLPTACIITITDIDKKILLEKTITISTQRR
ncbi:hypothetical protein ES703_21442 [subsurface metagenome]